MSPGQQYGAALLVAADGSVNFPVVFPAAFTTTVPEVFTSVSNVSTGSVYAIGAPQTSGESLTGFTIYVEGGAPGSTCTVNWYTLGGV
jgi:hypothetical protein